GSFTGGITMHSKATGTLSQWRDWTTPTLTDGPGGTTTTTTGTTTTTTTTTSNPPGGGSCTATYAEGQKWNDRFNGQVTVSGTDDWVVTVTLSSPQKVIATWNTSVSWNSAGNVMTARPNGNGNVFGFTVQHGGNWNWPALSCRAG
ncbi:hypothetical protein ACFP3R_27785, partial [Saccharothrix lopnurensis]